MSKIVSPYPPYEGRVTPAPDAQWWRMKLPPNDDQVYLLTLTNPDHDWVSVEFFDGYDTVIDTGFDKPTSVRLDEQRHGWSYVAYLDVLHAGSPTPSPLWRALTKPGSVQHPDDD